MNGLRSKQIWLAAMTLALQLSSVIVLTVGFCCKSTQASAPRPGAMACHETGEHAMCPMMKHHGHGQTDRSEPAMQSCCDPGVQGLLALLGTVGLLPSVSSGPFLLDQTVIVVPSEFPLPDWISPVDLPPPRA
jgi:hypothetical protein